VTVDPNHRLWDVRTCLDSMGRGATLVQGFFIDPAWYFDELPLGTAQAVLDPDMVFLPPSHPRSGAQEELVASVIRPVELLRCETYGDGDLDFGRMAVALNTSEVEARLARQRWRYMGVTAMLLVSLATGLWLLLRSVRRDLEQAQRTENFVAAVTHELRTPLSAIKLYGEMLMDGWVKDKDKQEEYYRRIVRETGRLETMVERVLEKGRVTSDEAPPQPGDLTRAARLVRPTLEQLGDGRADLEFDLADGLPEVLLIPDGVRSVLTNLVENARKYAPVVNGAEPIEVRSRLLRGKVVLEVSDRGSGIPPSDRRRIFDAFYRVGNEATRTSHGTGLGLHLVALQMRAMRGRIQVLDREGGGTTFRLTFRKTVGHETEYDVI
jgi:signal transduction histidine kinase